MAAPASISGTIRSALLLCLVRREARSIARWRLGRSLLLRSLHPRVSIWLFDRGKLVASGQRNRDTRCKARYPTWTCLSTILSPFAFLSPTATAFHVLHWLVHTTPWVVSFCKTALAKVVWWTSSVQSYHKFLVKIPHAVVRCLCYRSSYVLNPLFNACKSPEQMTLRTRPTCVLRRMLFHSSKGRSSFFWRSPRAG